MGGFGGNGFTFSSGGIDPNEIFKTFFSQEGGSDDPFGSAFTFSFGGN